MPKAPSPGETHDGGIRATDLRPYDRRKAVAARPEQPRRQIFCARFKSRIGVADRAIVADVGRDDRSRGSAAGLAPGLARRHPAQGPSLGRGRSRWCRDRSSRDPSRSAPAPRPTLFDARARAAPRGRSPPRPAQRREQPLRHASRVAQMPDVDALGQPDAIRVDVDLNDLRTLRPIVDPVAGQRRKRFNRVPSASTTSALAINCIAALEPL